MGGSRRQGFHILDRGTTQPFHNVAVRFSISKALEDFRDLFVRGEALEDLLRQMVFRLELLDLPDKFFFRMLDVDFVNTVGGFYS